MLPENSWLENDNTFLYTKRGYIIHLIENRTKCQGKTRKSGCTDYGIVIRYILFWVFSKSPV